jgi:NB-ARC domain
MRSQLADAHSILVTAYGESQDDTADRLPTMLASVCAKTPDQQAEFLKCFEPLFTPHRRSPGTRRQPIVSIHVQKVRRPFWIVGLLGLVAISLVAMVASWRMFQGEPAQLYPPLPAGSTVPALGTPGEGTTAISNLNFSYFRVDERPGYQIVRAIILSLPFVAISLWLLSRWRKRQLWIERRNTFERTNLDSIRLSSSVGPSFAGREVHLASQGLRQQRSTNTLEFDPVRTVSATAKAAGLFSPVWRQRLRFPEYVFLIERQSIHDHVARLMDLVVERLRMEGVPAERFYFQDSPNVLLRDDKDYSLLNLTELSAKRHDHPLIVLGSADGFFHPLSDRLSSLITRALAPLQVRYILSTRPLPEWSWRELSLLEAGFSLATARTGLQAIASHISSTRVEGGQLLEGILVEVPKRRENEVEPLREARQAPDASMEMRGTTAANFGTRASQARFVPAPSERAPLDYVDRPEVTAPLLAYMLSEEPSPNGRPMIGVILGPGGIGKTTVAAWLIWRPEIEDRFRDGLIWISLGKDPPDAITVITDCISQIEPSLKAKVTLEAARAELAALLQDRSVLIVIDDVWPGRSTGVAKALMVPSARSSEMDPRSGTA